MATDDLHARLVAAVTARLDLARRADYSNEDWTADVKAGFGPRVGPWSREVEHAVWQCDDEEDGCPDEARGWKAEARFIAAHRPADAIRRHEAALRVLQRHRPERGDWWFVAGHEHEICCRACAEIDYDVSQPWPCDDIRDVAASYGEVIDG